MQGKIVRVAWSVLLLFGITTSPLLSEEVSQAAAPASSPGGGDNATELAKQTQNPLSDLISLPLQNNFNFNTGPMDGTQWILNVQPVAPFNVSEDWMVITRTILPVIVQDELFPGTGSKAGLGDLQFTPFLSPRGDSPLIWGLGPVFQFPTATDDLLGRGKWSLGPSAVLLTMPGKWVIGVLAQNVWSVAGDSDRSDVDSFLLQYFVNYNFEAGWYVSSAPILTADWNAEGEQWTVPFGGGFGRVFNIGSQPVNAQVQAFYNVVSPDSGADWQLRFPFQFLCPK